MDWLDLLAVQGTLKSLLQHPSSKASILQRSVCLMCKDAFGQNFAELYAFLVKAVQVPQEALEHHLVLKMGKQRSRQEEKGTTEVEMVGWHHRLDGHEFE